MKKPPKNPTRVFNTAMDKLVPSNSLISKIWVELTSKPRYGLTIILIGLLLSAFVNLLYGLPLIMAGIFIRIKQMERTGMDRYEIRRAKIDGKIITSCHYCHHALMRENIWSKNYPTYQFTEKGGKFNYIPGMIPSWCPYAI
jgi:hypothetical protein